MNVRNLSNNFGVDDIFNGYQGELTGTSTCFSLQQDFLPLGLSGQLDPSLVEGEHTIIPSSEMSNKLDNSGFLGSHTLQPSQPQFGPQSLSDEPSAQNNQTSTPGDVIVPWDQWLVDDVGAESE